MVQFLSVEMMARLQREDGVEAILTGLAARMEDDFKRWENFERMPRVASHSDNGVIELMPTSDGKTYSFKYVNGHPRNFDLGLQTVTAFGMLADVETGYPKFVSEMTILTALRTAAVSAMVAKHLARRDSKTMAMIGTGCQAEFQALAFKALLGITDLRIFDTDAKAMDKFEANMAGQGIAIHRAENSQRALIGADIITTCTADKKRAKILTENMVGQGVHINAIGGDCPGKTELDKAILLKSSIFVEHEAQTRIEGEIQQLAPDHPVTKFWQVLTGEAEGRVSDSQITIFDSVGFAIEDFSALCFMRDLAEEKGLTEELDLLAIPDNPKNLFGMIGL